MSAPTDDLWDASLPTNRIPYMSHCQDRVVYQHTRSGISHDLGEHTAHFRREAVCLAQSAYRFRRSVVRTQADSFTRIPH